jgi:MSHA biogenesis protein MshJ
MNEQFKQWMASIDALSIRERMLILVTVLVAVVFLWWSFYAHQVLAQTDTASQQNETLENQIQATELALKAIQQQMQQGVFAREEDRHRRLQAEFERVNQALEEKTLRLVEPDQMFELMQKLVYRKSGLQLIELKRKSVDSVFKQTNPDPDQPQIYRHTLLASFMGDFKSALAYIDGLQQQRSRLLWDKVSLKTREYPKVELDIEPSTLSDSQHWVGL